jgi:very-short-patch-repair endonuclease
LRADQHTNAIRHDAVVLRSSGVFGFLHADVRAAKRKYKTLLKTRVKSSPSRMADELDQLADALQAVRVFNKDTRLKELCGARFRGIQTPFDDFIIVHRWMVNTEAAIAIGDKIDQKIRKVLIRETAEKLTSLLGCNKDPAHALLEQLVDTSRSSGKTIEDRINWLDTRIRVSKVARAICRHIGLFDNTSFDHLEEAVKAAETMRNVVDEIASNERARQALGNLYQGPAMDPGPIAATVNAVQAIENCELPECLKKHVLSADHDERIERLRVLKERHAATMTAVRRAWVTFKEKGKINEIAFFGGQFELSSGASLANRLAAAIADRNGLTTWIEYRRAWEDCAMLDLRPLVAAFEGSQLLPEMLRLALNRVFYRSLARAVLEQHPEFARMHGTAQKQARQRFQELDRKILKLHQESLAAKLARISIDPGSKAPQRKDYTGLELINLELSKKRHIPVRTLLERAGRAIQQMKPCFMMSPLSVAQFLKPNSLRFDLLVVDEASQMRPEEALGSIARSDQVVIVGDPMQLPPTSFFDTTDHIVVSDEDAEEIVDSESILDLALATYRPARELRWHYRSRHESLIAFSNRNFYDNNLIVFPSPLDPEKERREPKFGVFHHFVEGKYKSSLNIPEAQFVAEAAVAFMRNHPDRSLGVVTLNQAQRELLLGEVDRLIARDRRAQDYREKWEPTLEPFFVKNLENVQGDERDVIFISTVYGPDADTGVVMNRFGPVNSNVGHRRLNVLFTRAKERVDLFTSMRSGDIKAPEGSSLGVKVLKSYLEYAETGRLEQGKRTGREPDSDFEIFVRDRLVEHGFDVEPQVGVAGYFIDLAVKHPKRSGYLLGIECDGSTYHSSKSARDRDRLREEVLIGLKWKIYRIWSTDWFTNPQQEFARLLNHIEKLVAA